MVNLTKKIVVPIDGSINSLRSLDYIDLIYGSRHKPNIDLLYILPALPPILTDKKTMDKRIKDKLKVVEEKNIQMAERILSEATTALVKKGFEEKNINTVFKKVEITTARGIFNWVNSKHKDAVLLNRRGRSDLKSFFMGSVTQRLIDYHPVCPVWIVEGFIHSKKILVCMDGSENAIKAVDHAGFMLSGTDCKITIYHSLRHLRRYVPKETLAAAPDLEQIWKARTGQQISPSIKKAREMLLGAGLQPDQITTKVVDGSRSAAHDILKEAHDNDYGTIVLGRRGVSALKEFFIGSVTSQILHDSMGLAIWIV